NQQGQLTFAGNVTISGTTPGGAAGGDLAGNYPSPTVAKIQGTAVSSTAPIGSGQVLAYDGSTQYAARYLTVADLHSSIGPGYLQAFPSSSCTAGQTLTWVSLTDTMSCTNISLPDSQITYASEAANKVLAAPNGSAGTPSFRTLVSADLPALDASKI